MTYLGSHTSLHDNLCTERMVSYYLLATLLSRYLLSVCGLCHTVMYLERSVRGAKAPHGSFALSHTTLGMLLIHGSFALSHTTLVLYGRLALLQRSNRDRWHSCWQA